MCFGTQKNRLIETVILSTHNICLGCEIKKIVLQYTLLSGDLCLGLFWQANYATSVLLCLI